MRDLPRAGGSPHDLAREALSKAPPAILMFWVVKICATTVGETGGDAVSMSLKLGYLVATAIFLAFFAVTMIWQVASKRYHSLTYWRSWPPPPSAPPPPTSSTGRSTWATSPWRG